MMYQLWMMCLIMVSVFSVNVVSTIVDDVNVHCE